MKTSDNIVYYNGFWYSSHSPIGMNDFDVVCNHDKALEKISYDLRSLALIFDLIHVPRSHFLTFHNRVHWEVVSRFMSSKDFLYFTANGIILTSSLPYIDNYSDTERIAERVRVNRWSNEIDKPFVERVKRLDAVKIDSQREASSDVSFFGEYVTILEKRNSAAGKVVREIIRKSSYQSIPFVHEMFIEELANSGELDVGQKKDVWRVTNSLYMHTGCLELSDTRRISLDVRVEDPNARRDNTGLLRELYSPSFIQSLIEHELGQKYLVKYLCLDVEKVMKFRASTIWGSFKEEIFQMFETLSKLEKVFPERFAKYNNDEKILAYRKYLLELDSTKVSQIVADLIVIAAEVQDPITGKVLGSGKKIMVDRLIKWYSDKKLDQIMHTYREFWREFKLVLDNAGEGL